MRSSVCHALGRGKRARASAPAGAWGTSPPLLLQPQSGVGIHILPPGSTESHTAWAGTNILFQDRHQITGGNNDPLPHPLVSSFELFHALYQSLVPLFRMLTSCLCPPELHTHSHTAPPSPESSALFAFGSLEIPYVAVFTLFLGKLTTPLASSHFKEISIFLL